MKANPKSKPETSAAPSALPDVFLYTNYREYLKDYYQARKQLDPKFSLRVFAADAQFPSHGLLSYLMEGKRNLSKKTLLRLCPALRFNREQTLYFENLVFFNQAESLEEKAIYYERLVQGAGASKFKKLESSQLQLFRKWSTVVVREMLNLKHFRNQADWIAAQILPKVEASEIEESMAMLLETGLVRKVANGIKPADPDVTTHDEVKSFLVKSYHAQMLKLAAWAQDIVPGAERDISSVCFAMKASDIPALKKQLQLMRKELRKFASPPGEGERIVQVNLQLFPLTKAP